MSTCLRFFFLIPKQILLIILIILCQRLSLDNGYGSTLVDNLYTKQTFIISNIQYAVLIVLYNDHDVLHNDFNRKVDGSNQRLERKFLNINFPLFFEYHNSIHVSEQRSRTSPKGFEGQLVCINLESELLKILCLNC